MTDRRSADFYRPLEIRKSGARLFHVVMQSIAVCLRRTTRRQFGIPRLVSLIASKLPATNRLVVAGPDGQDFTILASGNGFGLVTGGFGISEVLPLVARLPRDAIVLDIGANIGIWSRLFAAQVRDGHVYCFEPSPGNFRVLVENMAVHDNATCFDLACSNRRGRTTFSVTGNSGLHHIVANGDERSINIQTIRLDDWVSQDTDLLRLDFIKIDVEGHEPEVLAGGAATINTYRPIVLFEYLPEFDERQHNGDRTPFDFFTAMGYGICRLDKSGLLHFMMGEHLPPDWTNDYIAFHPDEPHAVALKDLFRD